MNLLVPLTTQDKYDIFNKFFILNPITIWKNKAGEKCYKDAYVGELNDINKSISLKGRTNFGCIQNNDYYCIDIDKHEEDADGLKAILADCKFNMEGFIDDNVDTLLASKTPRGGLHIYFKHNDFTRQYFPRKCTGFIPGVDLCPQTWEGGKDKNGRKKGDDFVYDIICVCEPEDLMEMPDELATQFAKFIAYKMEKKEKTAAERKERKRVFENDLVKVRDLLDIIPIGCAEIKSTWFKIGSCLKHIIENDKDGYELFDYFSKRAEKSYAPTRNKIIWDEMRTGYGYTISFLKGMVMSDDTGSDEDIGQIKLDEWNSKHDVTDDKLKKVFFTEMTEVDIGDYWLSKHGNNVKVFDGKYYTFLNGRWKQSKGDLLFNEISKLYFEFTEFFKKYVDLEGLDEKIVKSLSKKVSCLGKISTLKNIKNYVENKVTIHTDIFDNNIDLLGFDNGVYDLKSMMFRKARYNDYVTMSVGYDYKESSLEDIAVVKKFINQIMPVEDEKIILMKVLSSCLSGHLNENVHFLLGSGRNGKDTLMTTMMFNILGRDYTRGTTTDTKVLTRDMSPGANPELASLNKIRLNVFSEPPREQKIRCDMLKLLTGSNSLSARKLHSNNTHVSLHAKHFIMQNRLLGLDAPDEAMLYRTFVYEFPASFLRQDAYDDCLDKTNKYIEDVYYKSKEFIEFMKMPMLHVLLGFYKNYQSNGYKFTHVPKIIQDRSKLYIQDSNSLYGWICENYEESDNEKDLISLKDIKSNLLNSDYYRSLSKTKQNYYNTLKNFKADLLEIKALSSKFFDRKKVNGKDMRSVFINFKVKTDIDIEEKLDDYDI